MLIISVISVHPAIQDSNPRAGLAQAAMVCVYCTYLTFSAVAMEPDDQQCNPLIRASGARTTTVILGAIVTFATVAYTTTRAATYGLALGSGKSHGQVQLDDDEPTGLVDRQPESRREMRAAALRQAVAAGSLPASALNESTSDEEDSDDEDRLPGSKRRGKDDERNATQYNYTLFHIIFLLSTMWVATLLTQQIEKGGQEGKEQLAFSPVGRTYFNSWTKIVSSWVCYFMFGWTLLAPVIIPDRFDY